MKNKHTQFAQQIFRCALLVTALTLWTPASAQPPGDSGIPVGVAKVAARSPDTRIQLSGTVLPWATSKLAAEVEGKVEALLFGEGQYVKKGTLLVQLDTYPLELERSLALAEQKLVTVQLEELQAGSRIETLDAAQAAADKAMAHFKMRKIELNRIKQLSEDGITSVHDYDNAKAAAEEAEAQYDQEKAFLREVEAGPRIEKIEQEEARLLAAQERIRIIEDNIERASIYAPFSGYVTKKETEVGQWLEQGDSALTLIAVNPLKVEVNLPQYYFSAVKIGTAAKIILESNDFNSANATFKGKVIEKIYLGDPTSRTFPVRIKVNRAHAKIAPGMLVRVELYPKGKKKLSLFVPKDAVVRSPKEAFVWVVRSGKDKVARAVKILVKTGSQSDGMIVVKPLKEEIKPGEWVIVQGNERLRPNMKVNIESRF